MTNASYMNRDFDTILAALLKRLQTKYADVYNDFQRSGQGMMLVDLVSFAAEIVCFYIDRRAKESYLSLAEEQASIARLTRQIGYIMRPAVSASTTISVSPKVSQPFEVVIPVGYQFRNSMGRVFELTEAMTFSVGSTTPQSAFVREGKTTTIVRSSTGVADQEFVLGGVNATTFVCSGSVIVLVDGVAWSQTDSLTFDELQEFEVLYLEDPPIVRFGNGISGAIPPTGAEIRITYVLCGGKDGNVAGINAVVTPLTYGSVTVDLTVTQADAASGGDAPETAAEAAAKAPGYVSARGVAITKEDYHALATAYSSPQYGAVSVAQAYVARTLVGDIEADNLMSDIEALFATYSTATSADAVSISEKMSDIVASSSTISSKLALISSATDSTQSDIDSVLENVRAVAGRAAILATPQATIDGYLEPTSGDILTIDELIAAMTASSDSSITTLVGDVQDMKDALTVASSTISETRTALTTVSTDAISSAEDIVVQRVALDAYASGISGENSAILTLATEVKSISDALPVTILGYQSSMEAYFEAIRTHLDDILSADGMANLITVPILSINSDGYYTAPSNGLIRSLETYLVEKSDVAHLVRVVSGAPSMVSVDITVSAKILTGYVFSEIATQIDTLVRTELKRRRYGVSLYLSRVHQIVQSIVGIDVFNVVIDSDTALDSFGNLIIGDENVIVPGTISVSQLME